MEKQVPLSKWAERSLIIKTLSEGPLIFDILLILFGILGMVFLLSGLLMEPPKLTWMIYLGIVFLLLTSAPIFFMIKERRLEKKEVSELNLKDWALSEKVRTAIDFLAKNPLNLNKMTSSGLQEIKNLKPVRIEYFPQQALEGELAGTFRGTWSGFLFFGGMKGEISGNITGESTPELTDQNMLLICVKENGDSLRLICPSSHVLRRNLRQYFKGLAGDYGKGSYTYNAIQDFWQGPNGLREILEKLNPQRLYDYLVTKLELPLGQRPNISVKGIQLKEGSLLVALIGCEGKESETVIPIDLMNEIRALLEEKLTKALPPIPLLENKRAS